jgi:predicted Zn finger-like uncharacterized protein
VCDSAAVYKPTRPAGFARTMILTCPNCSARFMIDGSALVSGGRTVRCGACGHSWHQMPEPAQAAEPAAANRTAFAPPPIPPAEPVVEPPPAPETPRPADEKPRRDEVEVEAAATHAAPRRRGLTRVLVWFLFVFVVAALVLGGYRYRNEVVRIWPPAMRLYEVLRIDVDPPTGLGLHVPQESLRFRREAEGGIPILVVSGDILNTSNRAQRVTPMRILLLDKDSRVLRTERVKIDDRTLDPGKRLPFQTSIPNAPPEAAAVRITFDITGG